MYYSLPFTCIVLFFFFKQRPAYEMRISDWSSDVALPILTREPEHQDVERLRDDFDHRAEARQHGRAEPARDAAAGNGGLGGAFAHRSRPSASSALLPAAFPRSPPFPPRQSGLASAPLHRGARDMAPDRQSCGEGKGVY